jgi:hypothetical protein
MDVSTNLNIYHKLNQDFTEHLVDVISPFVYEGIISIYKDSYKMAKDKGDDTKVIYIFQKYLVAVEQWSIDMIHKQTERIKIKSLTSDYLEKLLQTTIKTEVILMTLNPMAQANGMDINSYSSQIKLTDFIHRCYIECAKEAYNYSFLFYDNVNTLEYNRNQLTVNDLFKKSILKAVRKTVPIKSVIEQFDKLFKPVQNTMVCGPEIKHPIQIPPPPPINPDNVVDKKDKIISEKEIVLDKKEGIMSEISGVGIKESKKKEIKKIMEMTDLMSVKISEAEASSEIQSIKEKSNSNKISHNGFNLSVTQEPYIEKYGDYPKDKTNSDVKIPSNKATRSLLK